MKSLPTVFMISALMYLFSSSVDAQQEKIAGWDPVSCSFVSNDLLLNMNASKRLEKPNNPAWQRIGPGLNDILAFAFGSKDAETIFAASRDSGVFRTSDGGLNWERINNGITDKFIRSIASHPRNGSMVLAGTFSNGLFRTINGGMSWDFVSFIDDPTILSITFDPQHGDTVYAGTRSKGVFRSWDAGATWQRLTPNVATALAVIVDPRFTNIIYYSDDIEKRVYKSTNYGERWNRFFEGRAALSLANDPKNSDIFYVGALDNNLIRGSLFKSINGGQTWQQIPTSGSAQIVADILIDFNNTSNVYFATVTAGVFHSADGGLTWRNLNEGLTTSQVLRLKFHPRMTSTMYASTNQGAIFKVAGLDTEVFENRSKYSPREVMLFQNYPNPFNPETRIQYRLYRKSNIKLEIFSMLDQRVRTLFNAAQPAGDHSAYWDGRDDQGSSVSSGVYLCRLQGEDFILVKKMVLVR